MKIPLIDAALSMLPVNPLAVLRGLAQPLVGQAKAPPAPQADAVQFSPLGKRLGAAAQQGVTLPAGGSSLAELRARQQAYLADFQAQLGKLFVDAGVDLSQPLTLASNSSGDLVIANDHPDAFKIEAALEEAPHLRQAFHRLSANAALIQAAAQSAAPGGPSGYGSQMEALAPQRFTLVAHGSSLRQAFA